MIPAITPQMPKPIPSPCHCPRSLGSNAANPIPAPSDRSSIQTANPKKNPAKSAPQLTRFKSGSLTASVAIIPSLGRRRPSAACAGVTHPRTTLVTELGDVTAESAARRAAPRVNTFRAWSAERWPWGRGCRRAIHVGRGGGAMTGTCEVCGNEYDKAFEIDDRREAPRLRQLRVRDPGARAALRALRVPRDRPRDRGGGEDVLLRALRARVRRAGRRRTARGARARTDALTARPDAPPGASGARRAELRSTSRFARAVATATPTAVATLFAMRRLRRDAIRVLEESRERPTCLARAHRRAAPLAAAADDERDRAAEDERRDTVATAATRPGAGAPGAATSSASCRRRSSSATRPPSSLRSDVDLAGDAARRLLRLGEPFFTRSAPSPIARPPGASAGVVSSGFLTRRAQPHSPTPVPIASTTAATTSAAAQPGRTPASMSASTIATSRSWTVKSPQSPATPRPLAILISAAEVGLELGLRELDLLAREEARLPRELRDEVARPHLP